MQSTDIEVVSLGELILRAEFEQVSQRVEYRDAQNTVSRVYDHLTDAWVRHQTIYPRSGYYALCVSSQKGTCGWNDLKSEGKEIVFVHDYTSDFIGSDKPETYKAFHNDAHSGCTLLWVDNMAIHKIKTSQLNRWNEFFRPYESTPYQYTYEHAGDWFWDGSSSSGLIRYTSGGALYKSLTQDRPRSFDECRRIR